MNSETNAERSGVGSRADKVPRDVRIVAFYLYAVGFLVLALVPFVASGLAKPQLHRVLFGSVMIASGAADAADKLIKSICCLFCAWGLVRRARLAWWFSLVFILYSSTDAVLLLGGHQTNVLPSIAIDIALVIWLWFRRELYGVRLKKGGHMEAD